MKYTITFLKKTILLFLTIGVLTLSFSSCEKDSDNENTPAVEGIYIVNEGIFGSGNGSITLLDPETGEKIDNYFKSLNNRFPGDVVQDLAFSGQKGFIVANNSKKVEVVDAEDFTAENVIPDLSYPRQILAINTDYAYLTNGSSADQSNGHVLKIDLNDYTIADSIEVGKGPESLIQVNNKIYVSNSGGHNADNTISVIDPETDQIIETIPVGDIPTDLVEDQNGDVWVFCKGLGSWQTNGPTNSSLVKIDTETYGTTSFDLGKISSFGNYLLAVSPEKDRLYFVGVDGVYQMSIEAENIPEEPVIGKIPYGLDVNPENGHVYCLTSAYQSKGYAFRYDREHQLIDSLQVGYSPNAIVFE